MRYTEIMWYHAEVPQNVFHVLTIAEKSCAAGDAKAALQVIREYRRRAEMRAVKGQRGRRDELRNQRIAAGLCRCGGKTAKPGTSCLKCRRHRASMYHAKKGVRMAA